MTAEAVTLQLSPLSPCSRIGAGAADYWRKATAKGGMRPGPCLAKLPAPPSRVESPESAQYPLDRGGD
jgi:hypothetical protein